MRWLIFFFIIGWIVVNAIRAAQKAQRNASGQAKRAHDFDPAAAERTRRIQEEIRRKIAERAGLKLPPMVEAEPPPESVAPPPLAYTPPEEVRPEDEESASGELARQQALADRLRELSEARALGARRANEIAASIVTDSERAVAATMLRASIISDLRDPPTVRRAILLREILDRPVALR